MWPILVELRGSKGSKKCQKVSTLVRAPKVKSGHKQVISDEIVYGAIYSC